ncbi:uncharacterized protein LOC116348464 [Contarinia nasturtii]|uniref:uncharacterized protein LOC116348402 n=1 Tax=Contarinia nasturtii TaxID=265458 RepID=UPI0012D40917|nr:uncharacterized protein LOC116348402 [Contarinia nasturtii]XP_031635251.1 uncharacterized protein LOC116348402 [Contarinia nasturtii]XP_031635252.1 uncharacterized protein LOC116348402 [Contarinia nasturtii]XP_031635345.1 uncharacterized protein LOC116348464 [Contarinia nasturtii]XP_031635346.1 uncharacterized protein LOC116348464 [Contarinia nasturtii]XP_031635347.1 uncharacterized protein LOC116348464 [Contarinia nasturtii]
MSLKDELDEYLYCLERETQAALPRIERELERSGLVLNGEFIDRFHRFTINRIMETYDNFEIGAMFHESPNHGRDKDVRISKKRHYSGESDYNRKKPKKFKRCSKWNGSRSIDRRRSSLYSSSSRETMKNRDRMYEQRHVAKREPNFKIRNDDRIPPPNQEMNFDSDFDIGSFDASFKITVDPSKVPHTFSFACFHCLPENGANIHGFNGVEDVYFHWVASHALSKTEPFQFYLVENVACYYCDTNGSYHHIFNHQKQVHPKEPKVIVTGFDQTCALCSYEGNGMASHFIKDHTQLPTRLNDTLTNDMLAWLLEIDMRKKDGDCGIEANNTRKLLSFDMIDHVICGCKSKVHRRNYFGHIESHLLDFDCNVCKSKLPSSVQKFTSLIDVVKHDKDAHQMNQSLIPRSWQMEDQFKKDHLNTKIVFKNGLVVAMRHLVNTKFDISIKFNECVQILLDAKKKECNRLMQIEDISQKTTKVDVPVLSSGSLISDEQLELQKQNQLINDVFIHGIPYKDNEDLVSLVLKMSKFLGANIYPEDIAHVKRPSRHKAIITLRCTSQEAKAELLKYKSIHTTDVIPSSRDHFRKIHIKSLTTKYVTNLMKFAKDFAQQKLLHHFQWTEKGLFVKRSENCDGKYFMNKTELINYVK